MAPNLPGFINSVNPRIDPGVGKRPYTFAWLLGFVITSLVYLVLCLIRRPTETLVERALLPDEVYEAHGRLGEMVEGKESEDEDVKSMEGKAGGKVEESVV